MTFDAEDDHAEKPRNIHREAMERHPRAVGRQLDFYLAAVVRELRMRGVIAASPQRSDPAQRLLASIVLDCAALGVDTRQPTPTDHRSRAAAVSCLRPVGGDVDQPVPVVVTWDEYEGWCVGLHHDSTRSTRRYLHPGLLSAPGIVAEFVLVPAQAALSVPRTVQHFGPRRLPPTPDLTGRSSTVTTAYAA